MTSKRQSRFSVVRTGLRLVAVGGVGLVLTGCVSVGGARGSVSREAALGEAVAAEAPSQRGADEAPARPVIRPVQKRNPVWWIGNADDPEPPDWYRPGRACRRVRWHLRNPFHNFTFYVIGIADKEFERTGTHPGRVFHPEGGWTRATARYRCWRLPFVSYLRGDFKFYLGWRERGNFGVKLTF